MQITTSQQSVTLQYMSSAAQINSDKQRILKMLLYRAHYMQSEGKKITNFINRHHGLNIETHRRQKNKVLLLILS